MKTIEYQIDNRDLIFYVTENWDDFAITNNAPHLTRAAVIGQELWNYITDEETRHLYRHMVKRVRRNQQPLSIDLRCDSPSHRRYIQLTVSPRQDGGVSFSCGLVREEDRPQIDLLDVMLPRSDSLIRLCGWCNKIDVGNDTWQELEQGVNTLHLFTSLPLPQITHTMCPQCLAKYEEED